MRIYNNNKKMMEGVMSLIAELRQALYDLPVTGKPSRKVIAHFCEHDGIRIQFTRARTTWHAMAPSSVKPWWMVLEPMIDRHRREPQDAQQRDDSHPKTTESSSQADDKQNDNKKNQAVEVL